MAKEQPGNLPGRRVDLATRSSKPVSHGDASFGELIAYYLPELSAHCYAHEHLHKEWKGLQRALAEEAKAIQKRQIELKSVNAASSEGDDGPSGFDHVRAFLTQAKAILEVLNDEGQTKKKLEASTSTSDLLAAVEGARRMHRTARRMSTHHPHSPLPDDLVMEISDSSRSMSRTGGRTAEQVASHLEPLVEEDAVSSHADDAVEIANPIAASPTADRAASMFQPPHRSSFNVGALPASESGLTTLGSPSKARFEPGAEDDLASHALRSQRSLSFGARAAGAPTHVSTTIERPVVPLARFANDFIAITKRAFAVAKQKNAAIDVAEFQALLAACCGEATKMLGQLGAEDARHANEQDHTRLKETYGKDRNYKYVVLAYQLLDNTNKMNELQTGGVLTDVQRKVLEMDEAIAYLIRADDKQNPDRHYAVFRAKIYTRNTGDFGEVALAARLAVLRDNPKSPYGKLLTARIKDLMTWFNEGVENKCNFKPVSRSDETLNTNLIYARISAVLQLAQLFQQLGEVVTKSVLGPEASTYGPVWTPEWAARVEETHLIPIGDSLGLYR